MKLADSSKTAAKVSVCVVSTAVMAFSALEVVNARSRTQAMNVCCYTNDDCRSNGYTYCTTDAYYCGWYAMGACC